MPLDVGDAGDVERHRRVDHHVGGFGERAGPARAAASRKAARGVDGLRVGAQHREVRERRQAGALRAPSAGWPRRRRSRAGRAPDRADAPGARSAPTSRCRAPLAASRPARPAACISSANRRSGARKSLLKSALSGLTAATRPMRRKSWPLATICVPTRTSTSPRVHGAELRLERALVARAVGVDAGDARAGQQRGELLLEPLGAAADRRDVGVAAVGAGARHRLGEAAVVAAQGAVLLVEDAPGAAVRAAAQPAAVAALQHRRVAAPVEEDAGSARRARRARCRAATSCGASAGAGASRAGRPSAAARRPMSTSRTAGQAAPPIRSGSARRR